MRVLVTGSAGHLGEALMRTLPAAGHEPIGADIKPSPFTQQVGSIADRAFVGQCMSGIDVVAARGDAAQAARGHSLTPGFHRHQRHGHAEPARGIRPRRRPGLRFHQHDQRLRPGAGASCWRAGRVDHRRGGSRAQEHLRHHQGCRRRAVRAVPPQVRPPVRHPPDVAVLSRRGRSEGDARRLCGPQREGQRVPVPAGGHPGHRGRAPAGD